MQECDAVLAKAEGPEATLGTDLSRNKVLRLPNGGENRSLPSCSTTVAYSAGPRSTGLLEELEFHVRGFSVRWLGWREDKSGRLVRVTNTHKRQSFNRARTAS